MLIPADPTTDIIADVLIFETPRKFYFIQLISWLQLTKKWIDRHTKSDVVCDGFSSLTKLRETSKVFIALLTLLEVHPPRSGDKLLTRGRSNVIPFLGSCSPFLAFCRSGKWVIFFVKVAPWICMVVFVDSWWIWWSRQRLVIDHTSESGLAVGWDDVIEWSCHGWWSSDLFNQWSMLCSSLFQLQWNHHLP